MNWIANAKKYENELTATLSELIAFPSIFDEKTQSEYAPFGQGINDAYRFLLSEAKKAGFTVVDIDGKVGYIEIGEGDEMVAAIGHLDVVPVGDGWNFDPFTGTIEHNRLYGRGASDNKGPAVASFVALKMLKEMELDLRRRCRLILSLDEETHFRCMLHYVKTKQENPVYGFVPDASFPLTYAEKGLYDFTLSGSLEQGLIKEFVCGKAPNVVPDYAVMKIAYNQTIADDYSAFLLAQDHIGAVKKVGDELVLEARGVSVHGSQPYNGVNAAFILLDFIKAYCDDELVQFVNQNFTHASDGTKLDWQCADDICGPLTINVGVLNYIDGIVTLSTTTRYPKLFDQATAEQKLLVIAQSFGLNYRCDDHFPPIYNDPNADWIQKMLHIYQDQTGDYESVMTTSGGITLARTLPNMATFGLTFPGTPPHGVHGIDEWVDIDALVKGAAIYAETFYALANEVE